MGSWCLMILNNKDLGFPSGETWHRGGWVPLKFPWYCIWKFWFQDLAPRDHEQIPNPGGGNSNMFLCSPLPLPREMIQFDKYFSDGLNMIPWKKSKSWWFQAFLRSPLPVETGWNDQLAMFSNQTFTDHHRSPSQYLGGRNSPKRRFRTLGASWRFTWIQFEKWNRSMVDQPTSYI